MSDASEFNVLYLPCHSREVENKAVVQPVCITFPDAVSSHTSMELFNGLKRLCGYEWAETVNVRSFISYVMLVDEMGLYRTPNKLNVLASVLYGQFIVGDVFVLKRNYAELDFLHSSDIKRLFSLFRTLEESYILQDLKFASFSSYGLSPN